MKFVFYAFCFIGCIHLANMFYGPVIKNHMLEGKMIELSKEKPMKGDQYLLEDLASFIDDNHIDLDVKQVRLNHPDPKSVVVTVKYEVFVKFWFLEKDYMFSPTSKATAHGILPDFSSY